MSHSFFYVEPVAVISVDNEEQFSRIGACHGAPAVAGRGGECSDSVAVSRQVFYVQQSPAYAFVGLILLSEIQRNVSCGQMSGINYGGGVSAADGYEIADVYKGVDAV